MNQIKQKQTNPKTNKQTNRQTITKQNNQNKKMLLSF